MERVVAEFSDSLLFGAYFGVATLALAAALAFWKYPAVGRAIDVARARWRAWLIVAIVLLVLASARTLLPDLHADMEIDSGRIGAHRELQTTYLMLGVLIALPLLAGAILFVRGAGDAAFAALTLILMIGVELGLRAMPIPVLDGFFTQRWLGMGLSQLVELFALLVIALLSTTRPKKIGISATQRSHPRRR